MAEARPMSWAKRDRVMNYSEMDSARATESHKILLILVCSMEYVVVVVVLRVLPVPHLVVLLPIIYSSSPSPG